MEHYHPHLSLLSFFRETIFPCKAQTLQIFNGEPHEIRISDIHTFSNDSLAINGIQGGELFEMEIAPNRVSGR
jgi:hypothetical protein